MTQQDPPQTAMPRARVLSYLTTVSSPTQVRLVAARAAKITGLACLGLMLLLTGLIARDTYVIARESLGMFRWGALTPLPPMTLEALVQALPEALFRNFYLVPLFPLLVTGVPLLLLIAPAIRSGRRAACIIGVLYFAAMSLTAFLATFITAICVFVAAGTLMTGPQRPIRLLWLILVPAGGALCLLLKDIAAFLRWIARNPAVDKPSVPFLPAAMSPGNSPPEALR